MTLNVINENVWRRVMNKISLTMGQVAPNLSTKGKREINHIFCDKISPFSANVLNIISQNGLIK